MRGLPADKCKVPRAFWRALERMGLPPAALLRQARLPATLHLSDQSLVSTSQYFALWKAVEELSSEPDLGIKLVQTTDTAAHPPSSLIAFHARNYRDALLRLARFKRLCTPEQLNMEEAQGECTITVKWLHATEPEPAIATDVTFASLLELGRRGTGRHIIPLRVDYRRPGPKSESHEAYFGKAVRYGATRDALVLSCADLDHPFPGHNPELLAILTPALASALGELEVHNSASEQAKMVVKRRLASGRPDLSEVARELGMSERTLQRRITEEGQTFREVVAAARQELGRQLLSDPFAEIDEVACLLGYQDSSSFYRAFRDWEGVTPGRWRDLNLSATNGSAASGRSIH